MPAVPLRDTLEAETLAIVTIVHGYIALQRHDGFDRHALLQHAVAVVHRDAHAVDELRSLLGVCTLRGVNSAFGEM